MIDSKSVWFLIGKDFTKISGQFTKDMADLAKSPFQELSDSANFKIQLIELINMNSFIRKHVAAIFLILLISSCSEDDLKQSELAANAGPDQTVAPFSTVTLDGTASVGENLNYEWTYNGGPMSIGDLLLSNPTAPNPTFEPKKNGVYTFTLEVTSGIRFSEDQVQITVTGALTIGGTLTENLTLRDFEPNPEMPDYIISSDLVIPDGLTMRVEDGASTVHVKVDSDKGIIVQTGGALRITSGSINKFTADTGWKGILVDGGTIEFVNTFTTIERAGSTTFAGQAEAAAVTLAGVQPKITAFSNVNFVNSASYDILVASQVSSSVQDGVIVGNTFSATIPLKAPISFISKLNSGNGFPTGYSYVQFVPSGGSTIDVAPTGSFQLTSGAKYYIDGDFISGSPISMNNTVVFMKEGSGILAQNSLTIQSSQISGLDGASWKGIAFASSQNQMAITASTIANAGSEVFSTGFFTSSQKAAVYFSFGGNSVFSNSQIVDSGGYGIYNADPISYITVQGSTFTNTALPAVRTRVDKISQAIGTGNSFSMTGGVAAVEVEVPNLLTSPGATWNALGGGNYYLLLGSVRLSGGSWTLSAGVNLRFKSQKYLELEQGGFTAIGTAESPITFDSEAGTAGTWAGIHVQTTTKFEHCQIKNGGEVTILKNGVTPATEKANIVFNYGGGVTTNTFKNNTVSGSAGYGALVEAGKQNPDALNVANANSFTNNTSGNVIVK